MQFIIATMGKCHRLPAVHRRLAVGSAVALCSLLAHQPGYAKGVLLDFEGIGNLVPIQNFYNGGAAGNGVVGPDFDVTFFGNALALIDADSGGTGNFANEPTPDAVMFWLSDTDAHMNYAPGFTQFSLHYNTALYPGNLSFWTGTDGTGSQVGPTELLGLTGSDCGGDPSGFYSCWKKVAVTLPAMAYSVTFGGTANQIGFDNISFNPHQVNVPGPLPIVGVAAAFGASRRLRRRLQKIPAS